MKKLHGPLGRTLEFGIAMAVFDECWVSDLRGGDQRRVDACPVETTPYVQ